jgi:hypothetical protein
MAPIVLRLLFFWSFVSCNSVLAEDSFWCGWGSVKMGLFVMTAVDQLMDEISFELPPHLNFIELTSAFPHMCLQFATFCAQLKQNFLCKNFCDCA